MIADLPDHVSKSLLVNEQRNSPQHDPELTVAYLAIPILVYDVDHLVDLFDTDLQKNK
jgi:hypothetical protein